MRTCIIADNMHPSIIPGLENLGYQADYQPDITREELLTSISTYQGLIIRSKTQVDEPLLAQAKALQFVARAGAGMDNFDLPALQRRGITVINTPEANRDSLAEHALGMLLSMLHNLGTADQSVRSGAWHRELHRGTELGGKTIGLIGFGNMGQAFAQRLSCFHCQILVYDKYKKGFTSAKVQEATLDQLLEQSEVLSLHVPLTSETLGFYNYSFFKRFKKPLMLINTARGEILPLADLRRSMQAGLITQAALDVLESEPISQLSDKQPDVYQFLVKSPHILLSPHVAGWSRESYERINEIILNKLSALQRSGTLE